MWNSSRDGYFLDTNGYGEINCITVMYNENVYDISCNEPRFLSIKSLIEENKLTKLPDFLDNSKVFNFVGELEGFSIKDKILCYQEKPVPSTLANKILEIYHNSQDVSALVNFWKHLDQNPNKETRADLYDFLNKDEHCILPDGSFIAYRSVKRNFFDIYTGTIDNSIGKIVTLPKGNVNNNKSNSCGAGLHVASVKMAVQFGGNNSRLLAVKVFPQDVVVAINPESSHAYLRTCKYEVLCEVVDKKALKYSDLQSINNKKD